MFGFGRAFTELLSQAELKDWQSLWIDTASSRDRSSRIDTAPKMDNVPMIDIASRIDTASSIDTVDPLG